MAKYLAKRGVRIDFALPPNCPERRPRFKHYRLSQAALLQRIGGLSPVFPEQFRQICIGDIERCPSKTFLGERVDLGALGNELLDDLLMAALRREVQGGPAGKATGVDVGLFFNQQVDHLGMAHEGGVGQWRVSAGVGMVDVHT